MQSMLQCLQPCLKGPGAKKSKKPGNKRGGVSAEAGNDVEADMGAPRKTVKKAQRTRDQILQITKGKTLFAGCTPEQMEAVVDAMFEVTCKPAQVVIAEGDMGDNFYVVQTGEYIVLLKQKGFTPVHTYHKGDCFGELALMYNTPRAATVQCTAGGTLWALDRVAFRQILMEHNKSAVESTAQFLRAVPLLSTLTDAQRDAVGSVLIEEQYSAGEVIVEQNSPADSLYVIKRGTCIAQLSEDGGKTLGKEVARMGTGGVFGESALSDDGKAVRQASVVAANDVVMLKLTRTDFVELLGDLNELVKNNFNEKVLGGMEMFKGLSKGQQTVLVDSLQEEKYEKDEHIIEQDEEGDAFFIIVAGTVRVTRKDPQTDQTIVIKDKLNPGDYFGEMSLLQPEGRRMATVTANEDTIVMSLDRETFTELVGSMSDILGREAARRQREMEVASRDPILQSDLEVVKTLGVGTFGRVKLVRHKPTGVAYALKCMRKGQMVAMKQVSHVLNERQLLSQCDHPFLLSLVSAFQDDQELYMIFDLILGGELFGRLRQQKKFNVETTRFYTACVASAFMYLHDKKIVYRDLKPENLMFDADGYLKVVDFGFAKTVTDRTWTLCGTPDYLAPEVIQNKGHNCSADWWSFGILAYECLVGKAPYEAEDPMDIYSNILEGTIVWPFFFPPEGKNLIEALLDRNPVTRLGSLGLGSLEIIEHDWFGELSFAELERRTVPAPYIPDIRSPYDASLFDEYDEDNDDEELTEEERDQRAFWESHNTDPELFAAF